MHFRLKIMLGNAAMQTGDESAEALRKVASKVSDYSGLGRESGSIRDVNGNTVGEWEVKGARRASRSGDARRSRSRRRRRSR